MKRQKTLLLALLLTAGVIYSAGAVENAQPDGAVMEPEGISVNIRYFDKRIYYSSADPILVKVTVSNKGIEPYSFKFAEEHPFSINFDIRSMTNRPADEAEALKRRRAAADQIFFRNISIESGESFSFVENLRDYAVLDKPGSYTVEASLYPGLYKAAALMPPIASNRLNLSIRPPQILDAAGVPVALDVDSGAVLVRQKLAPDQVVSYLITARQKSQWEKFFLYMDLQSMIKRDGARSRKWQAAGEEEQRRMLARYRKELQAALIDGDVVTIPSEYQIERTTYNNEDGTVTALEKFKGPQYTEIKRYTYYLHKHDDIWMVVDYTVMNLGTE